MILFLAGCRPRGWFTSPSNYRSLNHVLSMQDFNFNMYISDFFYLENPGGVLQLGIQRNGKISPISPAVWQKRNFVIFKMRNGRNDKFCEISRNENRKRWNLVTLRNKNKISSVEIPIICKLFFFYNFLPFLRICCSIKIVLKFQ